MPELTGYSIRKLSKLVSSADFPLSEYLPVDAASGVFDRLHYRDALSYSRDGNVVIALTLVFDEELVFSPGGTEAFALVLGAAGGRSEVRAVLTIGPDFSLRFPGLTLGLRISDSVLRDVVTAQAADLKVDGDLRIAPSGISLSGVGGVSLAPAYLCGTKLIVEAEGVRPVFNGDSVPEFVSDQPDFRGLALEALRLTVPSEYMKRADGEDVTFSLSNAAIGTTGFTGSLEVAAADDDPLDGQFLGFPFRFREFRLDVRQNAILEAAFGLDVRFERFEEGPAEKWVALDVAFGANGEIDAALAPVQPPGASGSSEHLIELEFEGVARFDVDSLRLSWDDGVGAFYFSGGLKMLVAGTETWPRLDFDELGLESTGRLLLPDGAGLVFSDPLVVDWHFARLGLSTFRIGTADPDGQRMQIAIGAEVVLVEGIPAGASVEGLVVEWTPGSGAPPAVRFDGIGIEFGIPGSFQAAIKVGYVQTVSGAEFRGQGKLELTALDVSIEVGIVVGRETGSSPFTYMYLFADAELMPSGIPIAQTGLAIYGFQGLVAHNMSLALNESLPADQRYYELFTRSPMGVSHVDKWEKDRGQNALGFGVVLGTMDKGFTINVKGLLVVAFPDLMILLQARANFLKAKTDLATAEEGTLEALMVYDGNSSALTIDIMAQWSVPTLLSVQGSARAFFSFTDPGAFYLQIGEDEDGKRVVAQALGWKDNWLFSAGFWFRLDAQGLVTGIVIDLGLRSQAAGFWVEVAGYARGEMALSWQPAQWEGSLAMRGMIGAGFRGLSISVSLAGFARAQVARPLAVEIAVEACIKAFKWEVCRDFRFAWEQDVPPTLEGPIRAWGATPRHWTPYRNGDATLVTGTRALAPGGTRVPTIQPHSVISLDFAAPMVDVSGDFNEAVALADNGFFTIGKRSGWSASYTLESVRVLRDPDGDREELDLWGTWALETPENNTTLRLFSSERFAHDGSLTHGFLSGVSIDYCDEPNDTIRCVPLDGIKPGYGRLEDGSLYFWKTSGPEATLDQPPGEGGRRDGTREQGTRDGQEQSVRLGMRDVLWIRPVNPSREIVMEIGADGRGRITPGRGEDRRAGRDVRRLPLRNSGRRRDALRIAGAATAGAPLLRFCYPQGHGERRWQGSVRLGGVTTEHERWTVPAEMLLFPPHEEFEIEVCYTARLKSPDGTVTAPLGTDTPIAARFRTDGPPGYQAALTDYVAGAVPGDGVRPAYTGYDLALDFEEDYVPYLYASIGESLLFRLFDGEGRPVRDENGDELLVAATDVAPRAWTTSDEYWREQYEKNEACVSERPQAGPASTRLRIAAQESFNLTADSQYTAWLVRSPKPDVPLYSWSFTTSRFATFSELTATPVFMPARVAPVAPVATSFEAVAREVGVATVAYVDRFTVTPVTLEEEESNALLLESPEPLGVGTRLSATVNGRAATMIGNLDGTRLFMLPAAGGDWGSGDRNVVLTWRRDPGGTAPALAVAGETTDEVVSFTVAEGGVE